MDMQSYQYNSTPNSIILCYLAKMLTKSQHRFVFIFRQLKPHVSSRFIRSYASSSNTLTTPSQLPQPPSTPTPVPSNFDITKYNKMLQSEGFSSSQSDSIITLVGEAIEER